MPHSDTLNQIVVCLSPNPLLLATVNCNTVANNNGFGDKQTTIWFRVSIWGKRAEGPLKNYLKKGQQVFISGEFRHHEYQGQDGTTKTSLEVNANIVDLVGKKQEGAAQGSNSQEKTQTYSHDGFDDEIPFN